MLAISVENLIKYMRFHLLVLEEHLLPHQWQHHWDHDYTQVDNAALAYNNAHPSGRSPLSAPFGINNALHASKTA